MTRKDYELIAATIADVMDDPLARREAAFAFASQLASTNQRFDRQRFLNACLRRTEEWYTNDGREWIGTKFAFASQLASTNQRFDRQRFLNACLRRTEEWYTNDGREWIGTKVASY
jgi:hypothetical protein